MTGFHMKILGTERHNKILNICFDPHFIYSRYRSNDNKKVVKKQKSDNNNLIYETCAVYYRITTKFD